METISGVQGMVQENKNYGEELLIPDAQKVDAGVFTTTHLHLNAVDFQGASVWFPAINYPGSWKC